MRKLIILRGHQGSGKSTYAKKLLSEFNGLTYCISYDDIIEELNDGKYVWTPENIKRAQEIAWKRYLEFVKGIAKGQNVLIVHSATNQRIKSFKKYVDFAKARSFEIEVYRLTDFYENSHNCDDFTVATAFVTIENDPYSGEITLEQKVKPSDSLQAVIDEIRIGSKPRFNPNTNSYVSRNYLVCNASSVRKSKSQTYPELSTYKYASKVFFDNSFDDALLELRGMVLDDDYNIITRPFNKAFNLSERRDRFSKYPLRVNPTDRFNIVKKINGFLGCATYVDRPELGDTSFNGRVIYNTTGSLDSWYANTVKEHLEWYERLFRSFPNHTFMFEIVDPRDPHIIAEIQGEYLLAMRNVITGELYAGRNLLDSLALKDLSDLHGIKFAGIEENVEWKDLEQRVKNAEHEGYVVYSLDWSEILFKIKSPYYLITKFFARTKKLEEILIDIKKRGITGDFISKYKIDEEYFPLIHFLKDHIDEIIALDEQAKIAKIREFLQKG